MPAEPQMSAVERDKLEIDPDFDFREIARRPFESLTPNEISMFKWSGVYHQLQPTFFMIRLVTPGGLITSAQLRRAASLARDYGQGELCITTRQTLQFHWIRQQDIHKILDGMADVGMTTKNGCGDVTRNVVTCSLQGVCPHEVGTHVRELIRAIATDPEIRDRQRNLPRKHKISVAGCGRACAQTLINCQGWIPVTRTAAGGAEEEGWQFYAGGGLGARPYLAKRVFDWVPHELALPVTQAVVESFRRHGDRRRRTHARLKIVVDLMGARGFGDSVLSILRERGVPGLDRIVPAADPQPDLAPAFLDGQETLVQRDRALCTVRIQVPRSELRAAQAEQLADWADAYGRGEIMFTNRQNVEIRHVPAERTPALLAAIHAAGFRTCGNERLPDVVACVGTTVCRMAAGDAPAACRRLLDAFVGDRPFFESVGALRINITGCPNNCAHAWVADIGLRGKRIRTEGGGSVDGYDLYVGGSLAGAGRIGELVGDAAGTEVVEAVRRIVGLYVSRRETPAERFSAFSARTPLDAFRQALYGPGQSGAL